MAKYRKFNRMGLTPIQKQERARRRMMRDRILFGMRKIWERIKEMVYKIADLIPRRFKREDPEPATGVPTDFDKKLGQKIQQRRAKMGKPVDTSKGGPNMPRWQFCTCGRRAKRKGKTMGGAHYRCSKHGDFFVRAEKGG